VKALERARHHPAVFAPILLLELELFLRADTGGPGGGSVESGGSAFDHSKISGEDDEGRERVGGQSVRVGLFVILDFGHGVQEGGHGGGESGVREVEDVLGQT